MNEYLTRTDSFMRSLNVQALRVGGSVRDQILGRRVKDADYVVFGVGLRDLGAVLRGRRDEFDRFDVRALTLRDGKQAGWRVSGRGLGVIEVMLPRVEAPNNPRDIIVDPNGSLTDDARRRDFTFNALYYSVVSRNLFDPTERGLDDLKRRRINVTHADSFRDDPLRALRALRFVSTLDYDLGPETGALMALHADAVRGLSAKGNASGTVLTELEKLLMGQNPAKALRIARDTGVLAVAFPELADMLGFDQGSRYHDMTTDEHTFMALETAGHVDAPLRVRMALLFHDAGKPESAWVGPDGRKHYYAKKGVMAARRLPDGKVAREYVDTEDHEVVGERVWRAAAGRLNAPRALTEDVATLIRNHMVKTEKADPVKVRRERVRLGDEMLSDLYLMRMCDLSGKGNKNAKFLANVALLEQERVRAQERSVPAGPKDLEIDGHDVKALVSSGRDIGRVLHAVLDEVVVDPTEQKRSREWQLRAAARVANA